MLNFKWKRLLQKLLNRFGYQLNKITDSKLDPFFVQQKLITTRAPVIFDIGAHVGETAKLYRTRFPLASLHCFEPFPRSYHELSKVTAQDSLTICLELAVSSEVGQAIFNENANSRTNSFLSIAEQANDYWGAGTYQEISRIEVATTTVDEISRKLAIPHIDILKIDVQGAELAVLEGARNMFEERQVSLVYAELILRPTYIDQHQAHEYFTFFDSVGYLFYDFYNPIRREMRLVQVDVIFVSPSLSADFLM